MEAQEQNPTAQKAQLMNDLDLAHLAGFFDGVGIITINVSKTSDYSVGYAFEPAVRLSQPKNDEDPIFGKVQAYADDEAIRYQLREKQHKQGSGGVSREFVVGKMDSIRRFLEPLTPYLVSNYRQATVMLDDILPMLEDGKHLSPEGFHELMGYADDIRHFNGTTARKYNQKFFGDEFSLAE